MANQKSTVYIYGIEKKTSTSYTVTLAFNSTSAPKIPYEIRTASQMGVNLSEGISVLGLDNGGSFPSLLIPSPATLTYVDVKKANAIIPFGTIAPLMLEIPMDTLNKIRQVASAMKTKVPTSASKITSLVMVNDILPTNLSDVKYIKGKMTHVVDGDTFDILMTAGSELEYNGSVTRPGTTVRIRLTGINTLETKKDDGGNAQNKNLSWLASHGYKQTDENLALSYKQAETAKSLVAKEFLDKKELTVIVDDYSGGVDMYGRVLGEAFYPYNEGGSLYSAISINKSLIATPSPFFKDEALAEPYYMTSSNGQIESIFAINTWWQYAPDANKKAEEIEKQKDEKLISDKDKFLQDYNLVINEMGIVTTADNVEKTISIENYIVQKGDDLNSIAKLYTKGTGTYTTVAAIMKENGWTATGSAGTAIAQAFSSGFFVGKTIKIPILKEFSNTYNDYINAEYLSNTNNLPTDSVTEDYINHYYDDRDELDGISRDELAQSYIDGTDCGFTRIGDCTFIVPPTSIKVDTVTSNRKIPTLRSKSSIQTQTGHSKRIITLRLFFANEEHVNGIPYPNPADPEHPYYRNGLRPLVAQFKSAPFLPIENSLLNDSYGIYSIAFKDLVINTVPYFPSCIEATLVLYEFDHTVYMPHEEYFAGTFNWKLFRWYYQRRLNPKNAELNRSYHAPISILNDSISFAIPDETELAERAQAIHDLFKKIVPDTFTNANSNPETETGKQILDGKEYDAALAEYGVFKNWLALHPITKYPNFYKDGMFNASALSSVSSGDKKKYCDAILEYLDAAYNFSTIYKSTTGESRLDASGEHISSKSNNTAGKITFRFAANNFSKMIDFLRTEAGYKVRLDGSEITYKNYYTTWQYSTTTFDRVDKSGGVFVLDILAKENTMILSNKVGNKYIVSPGNILIKKKLSEKEEDIQNGFANYEIDFEQLNWKAHMSEKDVTTIPFDIDDIHVIAMSAQMSNMYSDLQLQSQECPTYQFMGSQDVAVNLVIKTKSKAAVKKFNDLVKTTQRLARDYRIAITSGILTINNNVFDLFGVKDFLIEAINVENSQEDKESWNIVVSMTAFDKTQRLREDLDYSSGDGSFDTFDQYKEYAKRRRTQEGFEYGVVDFKLKQLEVYPDLELPTYDEINKDLPYLGIKDIDGNPFQHLPNPMGAKFLDPDFYISARETTREYIKKMIDEDTPMTYFSDSYGFDGVENGPAPGQISMEAADVTLSEDTMAWIEQNLSEVDYGNNYSSSGSKIKLGLINKYESKVMTKEMIDRLVIDNKNDLYGHLASAKNASIPASTNFSPKYDGIHASLDEIYAEPTAEEVMQWGWTSDARNVAAAKSRMMKNPSPADVHRTIYNYVKKYFASHPSDIQKIKDGLACSTYMYGQDNLIAPPEITQEKIANVFKAMFEHESNWKQFVTKGTKTVPLANTSGGNFAIGITQLNLPTCGAFESLAAARRAAWDWQFNIERGILLYAYYFNDIVLGKTKYNNVKVKNNPLDYAIIHYNWPGKTLDDLYGPRDAKYYRQVMEHFVKYGADPSLFLATPEKFVDENLVDYNSAKYEMQKIQSYLAACLQANVNLHIDTNLVERKFMQEFLGKLVGISFDMSKHVEVFEIYDPYGEIDMQIKGETYKVKEKKLHTLRGGMDEYETITTVTKTYDKTVVAGIEIKYDHEYLHKLSQSGKGLPVIVLDPSDQFDKAKINKDKLINWQGDASYNTSAKYGRSSSEAMDPLQAMVYGHIQRRFIKKEDCYAPFDFSRFFVRIKDTAFSELLKISQLVKADNPTMPTDWDEIKWNNIYTLVDIDSVQQTIQADVDIKVAEATEFLTFDASNIAEMFRTSFKDILDYDHRGRLLRAFPTFQMFLIDEGRWMAWHKMWDNFYGYNSVISIDLMKDRRMAADTAVIGLSNVYHSLNTYDNDVSYGEWDYKFSDLIFGNSTERSKVWRTLWSLPDHEIVRARAEKLNTLILKPGARIHLRFGYGANAYDLPIVFNGTITEMDTQEIVTVVAQSDGIELTNKLNVDPGTTTDPGWLGSIKEPRAVMCEMLTSRGGYFKNLINKFSQGMFCNANPLGIMHFGSGVIPGSLISIKPFSQITGYGEAGVNVYSSAGYNTFSEWIYTEGTKSGEDIGWKFAGGIIPMSKGDEPSIQIYLFDKTPWDVFQAYAACCPDYIATVVPFEYRSTVYFGKPWWGIMDRYEYQYLWDNEMGVLTREPVGGYRKALSQSRVYTSLQDIISNGITATSEYMYTNVIGVYNEDDGAKRTVTVQADSDLDSDQQTTAIVHIPIQASAFNTYTQEKYATAAATSALRNYIKDMYQGELIVMGDPTVKPYDTMYINDMFSEMDGSAGIKRVVHHFSAETGFITCITPDCISIVDDTQGVSINTWVASFATSYFALMAGMAASKGLWKVFGRPIADTLLRYGSNGLDFLFKALIIDGLSSKERIYVAEVEANIFRDALENLGKKKGQVNLDDLREVKKLLQESSRTKNLMLSDETIAAIGKGLKPFKNVYDHPTTVFGLVDDLWEASGFLNKQALFKNNKGILKRSTSWAFRTSSKVAKVGTKATGFVTAGTVRVLGGILKSPVLRTLTGELILETAMTVMTSGIVEKYMRFLRSRQALTIIPLQYRKRPYLAGLDGHAGVVKGDHPGKIDKFLAGTGLFGGAMKTAYWWFDIDIPDYDNSDNE